MEAEDQGPFVSMIKLCQPTASQEAIFSNCPLARESENFADSSPDQFSSSADQTPSQPAGIVMVSPPGSASSVHQQVEDDTVFHTPPEHHFHSHLSSSEDQNLDGLCAEDVRTVDVDNGSDRSKKVRVSGEEFGETVPVGETEVMVIEIEGNEGDRDAEVIVLDSADSGEEMATSNLAEESLDIISEDGIEVNTIDGVRKVGELMKDGVPEVDAVDGNHELGKKCESMEDIQVSIGKKRDENSFSSGSLDSGKIKEEIVKLKCIVGNGCIGMRHESGVGGSEKVVKVTNNEMMPKDGHGDGGLKTDGKRIEEIDEFRYVGGADVQRRWKGRTGRAVGGSGRRRQLPVSLKGKEKNVGGGNVLETVESKSGLLDFLDVLKVVVGDMDGGCEDADFLMTAKRQGLTFPRARWWPPEGDDE
ncbi:hypothetical protein Pfo_025692 [Paulownia fortunei]|nr:hypothetical protein Pfo_025692 [Paulownia fortunei]